MFSVPPLPLLVAIALTFIMSAMPTLAQTSKAKHAYHKGNFAQAQALFRQAADDSTGSDRYRLRFAEAAAAYHQQDYPNALHALTEALHEKDPLFQEQVHYNLARTLTAHGQSLLDHASDTHSKADIQKQRLARIPRVLTSWQDALSHYDDSLTINPENNQANDNHQALTKLIAQLKKEQEEQQQKQQAPKEKPPQSDKPNQKGEQSGEEQEGEQPDTPQDAQNPSKGENQQSGEGNEESESSTGQQPTENNPQKPTPEAKHPPQSGGPSQDSQEGTQQSLEQSAQNSQKGETPAEHARRLLSEFADIGETPLHQRLDRTRRQRTTQKDW